MDAMGRSGADVARGLLEDGYELDVDGFAEVLVGADVMGQIVANVLLNEGHAVDVEGVTQLVAQEVFSACVDGARAAVCGVIA